MDKMLVIVFDDERKAYEGARALGELHAEGSLTLYAAAVIAKNPKGVVSVKQSVDQGPTGTVVGLATGSLIGLLGGPVGLVVGAGTGTIAGSLSDLAQAGVGEDFLEEVSEYLVPGKTAVVAEVDEEWVTPLDTRMEPLDGVVFRRARGEFIDAQIEQDIGATKAEIKELNAEYDQAVGDAKAKLQTKLSAAQKRLQSQQDRIKEKIEAIKREGEAKFKSLKEQAAKAPGEMKAKLDSHCRSTRRLRKACWQVEQG